VCQTLSSRGAEIGSRCQNRRRRDNQVPSPLTSEGGPSPSPLSIKTSKTADDEHGRSSPQALRNFEPVENLTRTIHQKNRLSIFAVQIGFGGGVEYSGLERLS
jgi:hypothetical protein